MKEIDIPNIKVKDLKLDNAIYDKSDECLELEVIKVYGE